MKRLNSFKAEDKVDFEKGGGKGSVLLWFQIEVALQITRNRRGELIGLPGWCPVEKGCARLTGKAKDSMGGGKCAAPVGSHKGLGELISIQVQTAVRKRNAWCHGSDRS